MAAKHVLFFLCLTYYYFYVNSDIICESGFCQKYIVDHGCPTQAPDCQYNNATHSGLLLPSPTICNCCTHCLPLYGLGQPCSIGGAGAGTTIGRCSHGLTCDNSTRTCIRMKTKCHDAQDDYDSHHSQGLTGTLERRPNCDNKGKYATFDCVPSQTCFCQSEEGERIFGEVPYTGIFQNMSCTCSRMAHKIQNLIAGDVPYPVFSLRCTSDGNFNPVQCLGKTCYCVNVITGESRGGTTIDLDIHPISRLPCYNADLDLFPHEDDATPPYEYTTPCLNSVKEREDLIKTSIEEGYDVDYFTGFSSISCLPDGTYSRMTIDSNGQKICINERGLPIGNFSAEPNTAFYRDMNCKCAITSNLMNSSTESPHCCKNGNFRSIQCRRGQCYCVDSNGRQIGKENSDVTRLSCYSSNWRNC